MLPLPAILQLALAIVDIALQVWTWKRWRGKWRMIATLPALIPLGGAAVGLLQGSNLWPFWGLFLFPHAGVAIILIWLSRASYNRRSARQGEKRNISPGATTTS